MTDTEKIANNIKRLMTNRRRRAILGWRFYANLRRRPWFFVLILLSILALGLVMTRIEISFPGGSNHPLLMGLWEGGAKLVIILVAFILALTVITAAPPQALAYEVAFTCMRKKFVDGYGNPPALISRRRFKDSREEKIIFYSAGISLESWVERKSDIQDALNVTYVKAPQYEYKTRHCILLTVVPGVGSSPGDPLYDDEL